MNVSTLTAAFFAGIGAAPLLVAQPAVAQTPLPLTEAVALALEHYPTVQAARFAADGASSAASGVASAVWPRLMLTTSATRYQEPLPVTPIHGFTPGATPPFDPSLFQGAASLRYTVFDGFGRSHQIESANAQSGAADYEVVRASQALTARVSATYLGVLGSASVLEAQDRRLAALEAETLRVRQLLDVGRAADVDLMRVEAALAAAQAERVSLAAALEVNERALGRLVGLPLERTRAASLEGATLVDNTAASRDQLLAQALQANPAVLAQRQGVAAAEALGGVARSARWPTVDLAANYLGWASANDSPIAEWNVGVALSWPVFTGGALRHQISRSDAEASAARERLRLVETDVEEEVDRALSAVDEAQARAASLVTAVARSQEVARIEQLRLEAGAGVQRDYLDAEAVLFANRAALVQAQYAHITARVTLARVTGNLDSAWLSRNLGGTP